MLVLLPQNNFVYEIFWTNKWPACVFYHSLCGWTFLPAIFEGLNLIIGKSATSDENWDKEHEFFSSPGMWGICFNTLLLSYNLFHCWPIPPVQI